MKPHGPDRTGVPERHQNQHVLGSASLARFRDWQRAPFYSSARDRQCQERDHPWELAPDASLVFPGRDRMWCSRGMDC